MIAPFATDKMLCVFLMLSLRFAPLLQIRSYICFYKAERKMLNFATDMMQYLFLILSVRSERNVRTFATDKIVYLFSKLRFGSWRNVRTFCDR